MLGYGDLRVNESMARKTRSEIRLCYLKNGIVFWDGFISVAYPVFTRLEYMHTNG